MSFELERYTNFCYRVIKDGDRCIGLIELDVVGEYKFYLTRPVAIDGLDEFVSDSLIKLNAGLQ